MVAMEHVYLVRVLNVASKDIIDEEQQVELMEQYDELSQDICDDISQYIYEKYCNEDRDNISVERMKICPISYEEFIENYAYVE